MTHTALVLLAHGSRDPLWQQPMQDVARRIRQQAPDALVACAFIELCEPDLDTAVEDLLTRGATAVRVLPLFLGMGRHARQDLPVLVDRLFGRFPHVHFELLPAIGEDPRLLDLLSQIGLSSLNP